MLWRRIALLAAGVAALAACSSQEPMTGAAGVGGQSVSAGAGGQGGEPIAAGGYGGAGGEAGEGGQGAMGGAGGQGDERPCVDPNGLPTQSRAPAKLSETGLYADIATQTLASYARPYQPSYELWSDGADKGRWIYLPDCPIGSVDMDHWVMPVGTRIWKTFSVAGTPVETRYMHRHGPELNDWLFAVYQWDASLMDADRVDEGVVDANGTTHDIPTQAACRTCHDGVPERVLGFGAIQLSHTGPGETMATLSAGGHLSVAAPAGFSVPGDPVTQAALGYLHANCGGCHNPGQFDTFFSARLSVSHTQPQDTDIYQEAVGVTPSNPVGMMVTHRIAPGDPLGSSVYYRMSIRVPFTQMPPLATEVVDNDGLAAVAAWINALPP